MVNIGNVDIPYIEDLTPFNLTNTTKDIGFLYADPLLQDSARIIKEFEMNGLLVSYGNKNENDYAEDLMALVSRDKSYNYIDFDGVKGFLAYGNVYIPKTAKQINARDYRSGGKYLPISRYERTYRLDMDYVTNDYNIEYAPIIALPKNSYNVKLKTPWDIIYLNEYANIQGNDGYLPLFKPFPIYTEANCSDKTGSVEFMEQAHGCMVVNLDAQDEYVEWTSNVGSELAKGRYKVVARLIDNNVASDIEITVTGVNSGLILTETFGTGSAVWELLETSEFQVLSDETITIKIKKLTADANEINIDYAFIIPTYVAKIGFDMDSEVDCGDVRVYDSQNSDEESNWKQIFNIEHSFDAETDIVIQNSFFQWKIDISQIWAETGQFKNLINDKIGKLYPKAFESDEVRYQFRELRPDYVEVDFFFMNGDTESLSAGDKEIAKVRVTPLMFSVELSRSGSFKNDWTLDISDMDGWIGTYVPDGNMISPGGSDVPHASTNGLYLMLFDDCVIGLCKSKNVASMVYSNGNIGSLAESNTGNYMMSIFAIGDYNGFEYLMNNPEDLTISQASNPLQYVDFVNTFDSSRFVFNYESSVWTWDTVNRELDVVTVNKANWIMLRSYEYGTGNFKIDVNIRSTNPIIKTAGILFGAQNDDNYYKAALQITAAGVASVTIEMFSGGIGTGLGSGAVSGVSVGNPYTLDVDWNSETGSIKVYLYAAGTARNNPAIDIIDANKTYGAGYVGCFANASASGTGNVNTSFKNFVVNANETNGRGVQINRILDDLTWDSGDEWTMENGTGVSVYKAASDVATTLNSSTATIATRKLNNVILGSGDYKIEVNIQASAAIDRYAGILFCGDTTYDDSYYIACLKIDAAGVSTLNLIKQDTTASVDGLYGVGGYGVYPYGGSSTIVVLASAAVSAAIKKWYTVECEYDRVERTFDLYLYERGTNKPATPTLQYAGDTKYEFGNVGIYAEVSGAGSSYLNVLFRKLDISEAEEYSCAGYKFATIGSVKNGSRYDTQESLTLFNDTMGTNLSFGRFNLFNRTKTTFNSAYNPLYLVYKNVTDSKTLSMQTSAMQEEIDTAISLTSVNELLEIGDDDDGDIGLIQIKQKTIANWHTLTIIDFMALIPVSMIDSSQYIFPVDLAYVSFNEQTYMREITRKEYGMNLIGRFHASYVSL